MRYTVTVTHENKRANMNVNNKLLQGEFTLPDFLKAVRESKKHGIEQTHLLTDYPEADCDRYEKGEARIPKDYLSMFATVYKLPRKITYLGFDPDIDRKNVLAERLKHLRLTRDISQSYLAFDLGISRGTYAKYEVGINEPDLKTLVKIADYYNSSIDYLAGRTN